MLPQTDLLTSDCQDLLAHGASIADAKPFDVAGGTDEFTEPETHAIDYLAEHAIELYRFSPTRLVFELPDQYAPHVPIMVKVARFRDGEHVGAQRNQREHELWQSASDENREVLAPVFACGENSGWVAMPLATSVDSGETESVRRAASRTGLDAGRIAPEHVGQIDGYDTPMLVDYGHL